MAHLYIELGFSFSVKDDCSFSLGYLAVDEEFFSFLLVAILNCN